MVEVINLLVVQEHERVDDLQELEREAVFLNRVFYLVVLVVKVHHVPEEPSNLREGNQIAIYSREVKLAILQQLKPLSSSFI